MNIGTRIYDAQCGIFGFISSLEYNDFYITWEDNNTEFLTESFLKRLLEIKLFIKFETEQEKFAIQIKYGK